MLSKTSSLNYLFQDLFNDIYFGIFFKICFIDILVQARCNDRNIPFHFAIRNWMIKHEIDIDEN